MTGTQVTTGYTVATAPRDLAELEKLGHYIHKKLAEELEQKGVKVYNEDFERSAFLAAQPAQRAQLLLERLQTFDGANGGGKPASAPAQSRAPATGTGFGQGSGTGLGQHQPGQPAGQQAFGQGGFGARTPAVNGNGAGHAAPATQTQATAPAASRAPAGGGASPELLELLNTVRSTAQMVQAIGERQEQLDAKLDALLQGAELTSQSINAVGGILQSSARVQNVLLGVLTLFGEQVLQAPKEAFIPDALAYADGTLGILENMQQGNG